MTSGKTALGFVDFQLLHGSIESYRFFLLFFNSRAMADENQDMDGVHFPFPFPPYPIQKDFMAELYKVLEAGKIGIFESPTGTVSVRDEGVSLRQHGGCLT